MHNKMISGLARAIVLAGATAAMGTAWDAGPVECAHSECSSGTRTDAAGLKWRGNTHLWIVNRAIELLNRSSDPVAKQVVSALNQPSCRADWEAGIWDADGAFVDYPTYPGSHFYNHLRKDWTGAESYTLTYRKLGLGNTFFEAVNDTYPNARAAQNSRLRLYLQDRGKALPNQACYQLGVAMHYIGDMTQPMHTSSLSSANGIDNGLEGLHPLLEEYVGVKHSSYPLAANEVWDQRWLVSPDHVFVRASVFFNAYAGPLVVAVQQSTPRNCTYPGNEYMYGDAKYIRSGDVGLYCFYNNAGVNAQIEKILHQAYQVVASYLYTAVRPTFFSIAAGGNEVWAINGTYSEYPNRQIIRYNRTTKTWDTVAGSAINVSVEPSGTPWVVTAANVPWRRENNNWVQRIGTLMQVGIMPVDKGADYKPQSIFGFSPTSVGAQGDFQLYRWNGANSWELDTTQAGVKVVVDAFTPIVLNSNGGVFRREANGWMPMGTGEPLSDIACGPNTCWAIGTTPTARGNLNVKKWDGKQWATVTGEAVRIAVDGNDRAWVATAENGIWENDPASGWVKRN